MAYTTIKKPSSYFNTVLYTGNGTDAHAITGTGFKPDMTWIKARSALEDHCIFDVVRGSTKRISPNTTGATWDSSTNIQSFDVDGFTIGTSNQLNASSQTQVSWNWLADNTTGSSNTDGSITTTVSANTTSGFSIVKWTGNGSNATQTIGHGLGSSGIDFVVTKNLSTSLNWFAKHRDNSGAKGLILSSTNPEQDDGQDAVWNTGLYSALPTSNVFQVTSVGANNMTAFNGSGNDYIAYCFKSVQGFSKFGSYTGNGSADGTFVYTGFKPAFVIFKITNTSGNWYMNDTTRRNINVNSYTLFPNLNNAETTTGAYIDMLSNGFKLRDTGAAINGSGNNFIYMAFAEEPLVGDNPATAR